MNDSWVDIGGPSSKRVDVFKCYRIKLRECGYFIIH